MKIFGVSFLFSTFFSVFFKKNGGLSKKYVVQTWWSVVFAQNTTDFLKYKSSAFKIEGPNVLSFVTISFSYEEKYTIFFTTALVFFSFFYFLTSAYICALHFVTLFCRVINVLQTATKVTRIKGWFSMQ